MVIGGTRACGKTTELIKKANKEHLYIICSDSMRAESIAQMAKYMELDIPYPITVDELPIRSRHIKKVLIDEVEDVLQNIIRKPVSIMSTSMELKPMQTLVPTNE